MKCWNSAFNAQGSRLNILVVHVRAVKIYVAAVEALRKKERQDETQFTTKIDGFLSFTPPLNANVLLCRFFFNVTLCMTKLRVPVLCLSYFTDNSIMIDYSLFFFLHFDEISHPNKSWSPKKPLPLGQNVIM